MAISTLAYKITADTKQFTKEMGLTRREMNLAKRVMVETARPADPLKASLASLEKLFKSGAIDAREYASATEKVRKEMSGLDGVTNKSKSNDFLGRFGSTVTIAAAGIAGAIGTFFSLRKVLTEIGDQLRELDELAKRGRALDISPDTLAAFRAFAEQETDLNAASAERALTKAQSLVQLAAIGDTEALTAFELGGQEVFPREFRKVAKKDAIEQLFFVLDRINKLPQELQTAAVGQIFGERRVFLKSMKGRTLEDFLGFEEEELKRTGKRATGIIEQFNDERAKLMRQSGAVFGSLAERAAATGLPLLEFLNRRTQEGGMSGRDIGGAGIRAVGGFQNLGARGELVLGATPGGGLAREMLRHLRNVDENTKKEPISVEESDL